MCSTQDDLISFTSVAPQENLVWQTIELLFFWHKQKPCKNFHYSEQICVLVIMVIGWPISFSYSFCRNIFNSGFKQHMFTRRSPEKFSRFLSPLQNPLYIVKFKKAAEKNLIYMDSTLQTTLKHPKNPVYFCLRKRCQIFLL